MEAKKGRPDTQANSVRDTFPQFKEEPGYEIESRQTSEMIEDENNSTAVLVESSLIELNA